MTTFVLHGGYASHKNDQNDRFFSELTKRAPENPKVLLIYFAKERSEYSRLQAEDVELFSKNCSTTPTFDVANEDNLLKQIKQADIVYLHGGKTSRLLETLKGYSGLRDSLIGKIVAGESAGAYAISTCFYSKSEKGLFKGLGYVPIKTICHYEGVNAEQLNACDPGLETLLLRDYEYKVFEHYESSNT